MKIKTVSWSTAQLVKQRIYFDIEPKQFEYTDEAMKSMTGPVIRSGDLFLYTGIKNWSIRFTEDPKDKENAIMHSSAHYRIANRTPVMFLFRVGEFRVVFLFGRQLLIL